MMSPNAIRPKASIRPTTRAFKRKIDSQLSQEQKVNFLNSSLSAVSPLLPTPLEPPPSKQARNQPKVNLFVDNLDELSYYDILGVRSDTSNPAIKQILNEMLTIFASDVGNDDDDEVFQMQRGGNSINDIAATLQKAADVLTNSSSKQVYDSIIEKKYSIMAWQMDTLRPLIKDTQNLLKSTNVLYNDVAELKDIVSQKSLRNLVSETLKLNRGKRLRNTATNRLRVQWRVNLNDDTNAGITEDYLLDYFSKYGEIIGSVMCSSRPGCAVLEFNTIQSVSDVILEEGQLKKFIVQDLTEAELISRDSQDELMQQLEELNNIAADVIELKQNLQQT